MPRMTNILLSCALGAAAMGTATAATAEEHTIYIYERGYFPLEVYYAPGDTLLYVNKTKYNVRLFLTNGSNISGGSIAPGDDLVLYPGNGATTYTLDEPFLVELGGRYNSGGENVIYSGAAPLS